MTQETFAVVSKRTDGKTIALNIDRAFLDRESAETYAKYLNESFNDGSQYEVKSFPDEFQLPDELTARQCWIATYSKVSGLIQTTIEPLTCYASETATQFEPIETEEFITCASLISEHDALQLARKCQDSVLILF